MVKVKVIGSCLESASGEFHSFYNIGQEEDCDKQAKMLKQTSHRLVSFDDIKASTDRMIKSALDLVKFYERQHEVFNNDLDDREYSRALFRAIVIIQTAEQVLDIQDYHIVLGELIGSLYTLDHKLVKSNKSK